MPERRFSAFLLESFDIMRREVPRAYGALCRCLARRSVRLEVGDETTTIRFSSAEVSSIAGGDAPASIEVRATKRSILDLIDARRSLVDAILADEIGLRGDSEELLVFHDGLMAYVHGAVRAPSFPALLRSYRASPNAEARGRPGAIEQNREEGI